jgi:hypothetical protein
LTRYFSSCCVGKDCFDRSSDAQAMYIPYYKCIKKQDRCDVTSFLVWSSTRKLPVCRQAGFLDGWEMPLQDIPAI